MSDMLIYVDGSGATRVEVRLDNGTVWLSRALMAALYGREVPTINEHLRHIYEEGELDPAATIRKFLIVRTEGTREVSREISWS